MRLDKSKTEKRFVDAAKHADKAQLQTERTDDHGKRVFYTAFERELADSVYKLSLGLANLTVSLEKKGVIVKD
jgi:hypothetical protein